MERSVDAERDTDGQRKACGHQDQLGCRRETLREQVGYGPVVAVGLAKIALYCVTEEAAVLHMQWIIQAQPVTQFDTVLLGRVLRQQVGDRIAEEAEHQEGDGSYDEHNERRL